MNRREFIEHLTDSLVGRVPGRMISEKSDYYRNYISEHAKETGRTEEEVIEELGPPELIAHTIVDVYEAEYGIYEGSENSTREVNGEDVVTEDDGESGRNFKVFSSGNGCFLISFFVVFLFLCVSIWTVKLISAFPPVVLLAIVVLFLWVQYKKRH